MTNYEYIKSMSVEEMAETLLKVNDINGIPFCKRQAECYELLDKNEEIPDNMCIDCMKQWLLQEVIRNDRA